MSYTLPWTGRLPDLVAFLRASIALGRDEYVKAIVESGKVSGEDLRKCFAWTIGSGLDGHAQSFFDNEDFVAAKDRHEKMIRDVFQTMMNSWDDVWDDLAGVKDAEAKKAERVFTPMLERQWDEAPTIYLDDVKKRALNMAAKR